MPTLLRDPKEVPSAPREVVRKSLWKYCMGRWIAGWVLTGQGILFVTALLVVFYNVRPDNFFPDRAIDANPARVEGLIESAVVSYTGKNNTKNWRITFSYEVDGKAYEGFAYTKRGDIKAGQATTVTYCTLEPHLSRADGTNASIMPAWVLLFACSFLCVGLLFLGAAKRAMSQIQAVLRDGEPISATVESVVLNTKKKINNKHPWTIRFYFHTSAEYTGRLDLFPENKGDPAPCREDDKLVVVYMPHNPKIHALIFKEDFP